MRVVRTDVSNNRCVMSMQMNPFSDKLCFFCSYWWISSLFWIPWHRKTFWNSGIKMATIFYKIMKMVVTGSYSDGGILFINRISVLFQISFFLQLF